MTTNTPGSAPLGDKLRIALLGLFGTFTEQAVHQVAPAGAILMPMTSAPQALAAVRRGEADRVAVPIGNSTEDGVNAALDSFSHGDPPVIAVEMHVRIVLQLAVLPGTRSEDIRRIGTHPRAWAQCRDWVEETFPGAIHVSATLTTVAAELLSDGDAPFDTALCNAVPVNTYGLEALFTDAADNLGATTRLVLVARPGMVPPPTGADKTAVQVVLPVNKSGTLPTLLEQFSARGVDLSRIESRPGGGGFGNYTFSIDIVDRIREERIQVALVDLHRYSPDVCFTGSHPCADGVRMSVVPGTTDEAPRTGRAWVTDLLYGKDGMGEAAGNAPSWPLA